MREEATAKAERLTLLRHCLSTRSSASIFFDAQPEVPGGPQAPAQAVVGRLGQEAQRAPAPEAREDEQLAVLRQVAQWARLAAC